MAWTTGSALLSWTANVLKVAEADLPDLWADNADNAVESAYEDLLAVLANTSYSGDQISTSDQAANWNLQQGLYVLSGFGGGFGDYPREWFDRFNIIEFITRQAKENNGIALTSAGVPIAPDSTSAVGGIRYGTTLSLPTICQIRNRFYGTDPRGRWW